MIFFLKCPVEIGKVVETNGQRDVQNGGVPLFKQLHRFFQAQIVDIFHAGHIHVLLEKTHEMIVAEVALFSQIRDRNWFCVMKLNIVEHIFQLVGDDFVIERGLPCAVLKQQENCLQKKGF